jgi:hypothetical protein
MRPARCSTVPAEPAPATMQPNEVMDYPRSAEANRAGSLAADGAAANSVSLRAVDSAVLLVRNHGGLGNKVYSPLRIERGNGRNGPDTTVLSDLSNISALCTTPMPDWTSV